MGNSYSSIAQLKPSTNIDAMYPQLSLLPVELIMCILKYLDMTSIACIREVCRLFKACSLNLFWNVGVFIKGDLCKDISELVLLEKGFLRLKLLNHEIPIEELRETIFNEMVIDHNHYIPNLLIRPDSYFVHSKFRTVPEEVRFYYTHGRIWWEEIISYEYDFWVFFFLENFVNERDIA